MSIRIIDDGGASPVYFYGVTISVILLYAGCLFIYTQGAAANSRLDKLFSTWQTVIASFIQLQLLEPETSDSLQGTVLRMYTKRGCLARIHALAIKIEYSTLLLVSDIHIYIYI